MRNEVRALRRVAHLRAFPNFIAYSQYHGQYKKIKVGFIMEHFGGRETGKTATLLDVIEHRRNAPNLNKCQAVLVSLCRGGFSRYTQGI